VETKGEKSTESSEMGHGVTVRGGDREPCEREVRLSSGREVYDQVICFPTNGEFGVGPRERRVAEGLGGLGGKGDQKTTPVL